jgi:ribosome maturation factor RimP
MNKKDIIAKVAKICEELSSQFGFELVDVEYLKEHGDYFLRVYIHKSGGVNLDDCQLMSESLGERLDETNFIETAYYLEVSSPGLDRPLKNDKDLERNLGNEVEVHLYQAIDGAKKVEGNLERYDESAITIKTVNKEYMFPRDSVSLIRLTIKF